MAPHVTAAESSLAALAVFFFARQHHGDNLNSLVSSYNTLCSQDDEAYAAMTAVPSSSPDAPAIYNKRTEALAAVRDFAAKYPLAVAYAKHEASIKAE